MAPLADDLPRSPIVRLVGVYDADSTLRGEVTYWIGARPGRIARSVTSPTASLANDATGRSAGPVLLSSSTRTIAMTNPMRFVSRSTASCRPLSPRRGTESSSWSDPTRWPSAQGQPFGSSLRSSLRWTTPDSGGHIHCESAGAVADAMATAASRVASSVARMACSDFDGCGGWHER